MMSNPPWNSPFTYNCGKVGQSENFFNPSLTVSSFKISKNPNLTWCSLKMATICLEKPHCGDEGEPFMKSITGAADVNLPNLSLSSSGEGSSAGSSAACGACGAELAVLLPLEDSVEADPENWFNAAINSLGSAPLNSFKMVELRIKRMYGTAETSNNSLMSRRSSALMERNVTCGFASANVLITEFMVWHGAAHGVWK